MANWLQVPAGGTATVLLNPAFITYMEVTGSGTNWNVTVYALQNSSGVQLFGLYGNPFASSDDAVAAMQAAVSDNSSVNLTITGSL